MSHVVYYQNYYHFKKNFYLKQNQEILVTACGLHLPDVTLVPNDPKTTIPHCIKCIQHLMPPV